MGLEKIKIGQEPDDGTGDALRVGAIKINAVIDQVNNGLKPFKVGELLEGVGVPIYRIYKGIFYKYVGNVPNTIQASDIPGASNVWRKVFFAELDENSLINLGNLPNLPTSKVTGLVSKLERDIKSISITGDTNKILTLTKEDGTVLQSAFTDIDTDTNTFLNGLNFNINTGAFTAVLEDGSTSSVNLDGRFALISQLPDVSGFVPFTGALKSLDLGRNSMSARSFYSVTIDSNVVNVKGGEYAPIFKIQNTLTGKVTEIKQNSSQGNSFVKLTLPKKDGEFALISDIVSPIKTAKIEFTADELLSGVAKVVVPKKVNAYHEVIGVSFKYKYNTTSFNTEGNLQLLFNGKSNPVANAIAFSQLCFSVKDEFKRFNLSNNADISVDRSLELLPTGFTSGDGAIKIYVTYKEVQL